MGRYLMILAALIWTGSLVAFLLFVPLFSVASVALMVAGLALMFAFGIEVCRSFPEPQVRPPNEDSREQDAVAASPWPRVPGFFSRRRNAY